MKGFKKCYGTDNKNPQWFHQIIKNLNTLNIRRKQHINVKQNNNSTSC